MPSTGQRVATVRYWSPSLRPCPLCGGHSEFNVTGDDYLVGCAASFGCPVYAVAGPYPTAAEAAKAWNVRTGADDDTADWHGSKDGHR